MYLEGIGARQTCACEFGDRERQEAHERCPSCKRLSDSREQAELLRACHDEAPKSGVCIHSGFQVREYLWNILRFVEDETVLVTVKETTWVLPRKAGNVGILER